MLVVINVILQIM